MANNLVLQLLLKTGSFSSDLKTAKGQVQNFQQGCQTAGKSLDAFGKAIGIDIGALTKFGGAVGIAVAAGKGLKAVIDSNQTSADAFQAVMYSAKTAVSELAYAIGTFDFSNFQDGLSGLISRAREAAGAIDQLGNTLMSYNIAQAKAQAAIAKARAGQKNPNLSKEEKQVLVDAANQALEEAREATSVALEDFETAIVAEVNAKGAKLTGEGAMVLVDKFLTLDGKRVRDDVKQSMKVAQTEYDKALAKLNQDFGPQSNNTFSGNFGTFSYSDRTWKNNPEYIRQLDQLNEQYKELHVYNTLLVKEQDKELEKLGQQRVNMYQLEGSLANMDRTLDMVEGKVNGTTGATQKGTEAIKESLSYWQKIQQEAQKNRDASVYMSEVWKDANSQLDEALRKIELITAAMERAKTESKYGTEILTPITGQNLTGQVENTKPSGLAGEESKKTIEDIEKSLASYQEVQKKTFDPKLLAFYNQRIKELREELDRMNNLGVETPAPDDSATKKWDSFNSAMADTSTIVSNLAETFQEGTKVTAASILKMVSTSLPAVSSLIGAIAALSGVEATEKAVSTSKHWIEAIAAVAALGATVAAALAAAKKGGKFANGGIVGGSSFTGDRVTAQVNSGEMILNKAQQARLFKLANGGATGGQVEFHISGTELVGVLNNQNRKNNLIR